MRLSNLKLLLGKTEYQGSPKSDHLIAQLARHGLRLSAADVSEIFWEKQTINDDLAAAIETAFLLPPGWMDQSNSIIFSLNEQDLSDIRLLRAQKARVRESVRHLLSDIPIESSTGSQES